MLSQDSDCFAYGAKRVYRNFSISSQGNVSAQGGFVDIYDIETVRQTYDIGQQKIVIMALLCGCDYCPGIEGIGKDTVIKFFADYSEDEIMDKVKTWRLHNLNYTELEIKVDSKNLCVNCGHFGRVKEHAKNGCTQCRQHQGCDETLWKKQRLTLKAELAIRKKALLDPDFPSKDIIKEFLDRPAKIKPFELSWRKPNLFLFITKLSVQLQWSSIYAFQKFFPLLTRWQLLQKTVSVTTTELCTPTAIIKKRNPKGIPSYEIVWDRTAFTNLIPKDEPETLFNTVEPADLVEKLYPELVEAYVAQRAKPKNAVKEKNKKKKKTKDPNTSLNDMSGMLDELLEVEKELLVQGRKRHNSDLVQTKLSHFYSRQTQEPSSSPMRLSEIDFEVSSTDDELNLSAILTDIINRSPKQKRFRGQKLRYEQMQVNQQEISTPNHRNRRGNVQNIQDENNDYELMTKTVEHTKRSPSVPKSLRKVILGRNFNISTLNLDARGSSTSIGDTLDLSIDTNVLTTNDVTALNIDDSFGLENYVPLTKGFKKKLF